MDDDGNEQDADGILGGGVDEMVEGIVIAHEYGEGIVAWYGEEGTAYGNGEPLFFAEDVEDVFNGGEAEAYADGIDDAVEMLVEIGIFAQYEPQGEEFECFFGQGCYEECLGDGTDEGGGFCIGRPKGVMNEHLNSGDGHAYQDAIRYCLEQPREGFGLGVFLPDIQPQQDCWKQGGCEYYEWGGYHRLSISAKVS